MNTLNHEMRWQMVQLVEHVPCKPDDLSLHPQTHVKMPDVVTHICKPGIFKVKWETEKEESPRSSPAGYS